MVYRVREWKEGYELLLVSWGIWRIERTEAMIMPSARLCDRIEGNVAVSSTLSELSGYEPVRGNSAAKSAHNHVHEFLTGREHHIKTELLGVHQSYRTLLLVSIATMHVMLQSDQITKLQCWGHNGRAMIMKTLLFCLRYRYVHQR